MTVFIKRYFVLIPFLVFLTFICGCLSRDNQATKNQEKKDNSTTKIPVGNITYILANQQNSFALTDRGELYAWGRNDRGELGIGHNNNTNTPVKNPLDKKIKQIVPGAFCLALTEDDEVFTWGVNDFGVNVADNISFVTTPVKFDMPESIAKICNAGVGLAISKSGSLYTWGWNYYGQRGDGTRTHSFKPHKIALTQRVIDASCNDSHVMVLTEDGSVYTWGSNFFGEIGDESTVTYKPGDKLIENTIFTPHKVNFDKKITAIATGRGVSYALAEDGVLYSWGDNAVGQLGIANNKVYNSSVPLKVSIPNKVKMIVSGDFHALAVAEDGTLYSWGYNSSDGKIRVTGTGSTERVVFEPKIVKIEGEITFVSAGNGQTWLMTKENGIYGWGANHNGQINSDLPPIINMPTKINLNLK